MSRTAKTSVAEWLDTIGRRDLDAARQVQRAIDASYIAAGHRLPTGEAREMAFDELMPMERAFFGRAWADTTTEAPQ
jgi:hypothetical protein